MKRTLFVTMAFLALFLMAAPPAPAVFFNYDNFSSTTNLLLLGCASQIDNKLDLTYPTDIVGGVFYNTPVALPANYAFTTKFTFSLTTNISGDGMTFCLHQDAYTALGQGYSGLMGYAGDVGVKIDPSIAVEFDTFHNVWWDPAESTSSHIAIVKHGDVGNHLAYTYPNYPLNSGTLTAWIEYDGSNLRVYLNSTTTKPVDSIINHSIDLSGILTGGTIGGTNVYVGFTAGNNYNGGRHYLHSWTFNAVPLPPGVLLLGSGLLGLLSWGRFRKE